MAAKVLLLALALFCAASAAPENREGRIVGGSPVSIEEFPYVVSLEYFYPGIGLSIQRCVGGLVSSFHVLSTSFCFFQALLPNMRVRAGSTYSLSGGMAVDIYKVIQHPDYVSNPRVNDIAVVVLETPLPIGSTINVLYLPPQGASIYDGTQLKVVSWGFEAEQGPQIDSLKTVTLTKINLDVCKAAFADIANVDITDTAMCAAKAGYGTCFGDSGAPVVINNVVVGISSVYHECGTDVYPDVFTRVDRFTEWILEVATAPGRTAEPYSVPRVY